MKKILIYAAAALIALSCSPSAKQAQPADDGCFGLSAQIHNIDARSKVCIDGDWKAFIDLYETGYYDYRGKPMEDSKTFFADDSYHEDPTKLIEYDFDTADELKVPGDWNTQRPELYLYEGTIWYRQHFNASPKEGRRTFLYFGAANYEAVVGINGGAVARHVGGYTPFNVEVTDKIVEGENTLIVKVDNKRIPEGVPTTNSDWWNYGGITRSVYVVDVPETFIRDYSVQLSADRQSIYGWVQLDGTRLDQTVKVNIPELGLSVTAVTDENGKASFKTPAEPVLWSPENPKLYAVNISSETDTVEDRIGFRTIETRGTQIVLNGEPVFCKGICIHEEMPYAPSGRVTTEEQARTLLTWAKELGCNFVRLAHYPHHEIMVKVAEEMGIMVWDEIPVYWTIHWDNPDTYANAEHQLVDMITRDRNRANVIIWSVSNETPRGDSRLAFLCKLIDKAREMDPTRLVSSAMEKEYIDEVNVTVKDELAEHADILSFNQYIGWYDGDSDKCEKVKWSFPVDKPVMVTEMGGGAKYGLHADKTIRFSEEYQEELFRKNMVMLDNMPGLAGVTPWILKDFRSPRRFLPDIQDDFNRKGLVSEQGEKKLAFYVYRDWHPEVK